MKALEGKKASCGFLRSRLEHKAGALSTLSPTNAFWLLTKSEMQELLHDFSKSSLVPAVVEVHTLLISGNFRHA